MIYIYIQSIIVDLSVVAVDNPVVIEVTYPVLSLIVETVVVKWQSLIITSLIIFLVVIFSINGTLYLFYKNAWQDGRREWMSCLIKQCSNS